MAFKITDYNSIKYSYKKHCYQIYKPKQGGHNNRGLNRLFNLVEVFHSYYSETAVFRADFHPNDFNIDNKMMSQFLKGYISKLETQYNCKVGYFCAREQNTSDKEHYHLVLMLSGHKINYPDKLLNQLKLAWEVYSKGVMKMVDNPFYIMYRGDKASIDPVIYRLSYLTKKYTKERNKPAHDYLCNNIKLNEKYKDDYNNDALLVDPLITHRKHQKSQQNMVQAASCVSKPVQQLEVVELQIHQPINEPNKKCTSNTVFKPDFTYKRHQPSHLGENSIEVISCSPKGDPHE